MDRSDEAGRMLRDEIAKGSLPDDMLVKGSAPHGPAGGEKKEKNGGRIVSDSYDHTRKIRIDRDIIQK